MKKTHKYSNIYFLSDLWLDDQKIFTQLRLLFVGLNSNNIVPDAFVFMGNFTSRPFGQEWNDMPMLKHYFHELAKLIENYPSLVNGSKFVFVPGPWDPGNPVFPKPALPHFLMHPLESVSGDNLISATNPCRIRIGTKEIAVFREDLINTMRRNCIIDPIKNITLQEHFAHTIANCSHLCPLPENLRPIHWNYDNSLWLYPLPHLVVCGDKYQSYSIEYEDCKFVNPGSFLGSYRFVNYEPFNDETVTFCEVMDID
eukprot:TRINITY_DN4458_c0_g1_i1.p1 TRINITY_DN4458_c0_g1~~TRINITY_DN4458_c0_g1_i1.p1  ORF type:complete len:256 (-),score=32.21 TRINITY_DN4458_c0_g1_i1:31-798(-)